MVRTRDMMNESFVDRIRDNQRRSEKSGGGSYFKSNLPQGLKFWKNTPGPHQIDIITYYVGPNDPRVLTGDEEEGYGTYVLEFYVHDNIGMSDGGIMCLAKTLNRQCPICEDHKKKSQEGYDDKLLWKLKPKKNPRSVYNIIDVDNESAGVQVWHTSHFLMEMYLLELANIPVRPGQTGIDPVIDFPHPKYGKTIAFKTESKKTKEGQEMTVCVAHRFVDRPEGFVISQKTLDDAWCLDDLLYIPTYEDVCTYYWGPGGRERGGEEEERRPRGRYANEEAPPSRGRGEARTESQQEEEPAGRRSRRVEPDDAQEPARGRTERAQQASAGNNPCPHGYKYGEDCDKHPDECEKCDEWKGCARTQRTLNESATGQQAVREERSAPASEEGTSRRSRRSEEADNAGEAGEQPPTRRSRRG